MLFSVCIVLDGHLFVNLGSFVPLSLYSFSLDLMYDQEKKVQRAQLTSDTLINSLSALLQFCGHPNGSKHSVYHTLPGTGMLSKIFL